MCTNMTVAQCRHCLQSCYVITKSKTPVVWSGEVCKGADRQEQLHLFVVYLYTSYDTRDV